MSANGFPFINLCKYHLGLTCTVIIAYIGQHIIPDFQEKLYPTVTSSAQQSVSNGRHRQQYSCFFLLIDQVVAPVGTASVKPAQEGYGGLSI
jgi:hypothetical protein